MKKITIVIASSGQNLELGQKIQNELKAKGAQTSLLNLVDLDLPLYSTLAEGKFNAQEIVAPFQNELNSDAFVFVAPEYNGSIPPVLNNFLAWVSRSTKDWRQTFNRKPALIATASGGGGTQALIILRLQLAFIGMNVHGRQIISTFSKPVAETEIQAVTNEFFEHL